MLKNANEIAPKLRLFNVKKVRKIRMIFDGFQPQNPIHSHNHDVFIAILINAVALNSAKKSGVLLKHTAQQ